MSAVLAIDQGTSATKAVIADATGPLVEVDVPLDGLAYDGDRVEQDPEALLRSIVAAGRRALSQAQQPVSAVGLGNQGETVLAWDTRTGEPLGPALSWQDRRSVHVTEDMPPDVSAALHALTGLPLDPYFAAPKMAWLRREIGIPAGGSIAITTIDAWTTYRLTGAFVTDAATASRTMLLDPRTLQWSAEALDAFGLQGLPMPEVLACDERIGTTDAFGPALPVTASIVDQQAALLAQDCRQPGDAKCTYGTGVFILANVGGAHVHSTRGLATSLAWALADGTRASCVDGQVYTAGAAVSWLDRIGLIDGPDDLDAQGGTVSDSGGVVFVPSLAGVGAPLWRPDARGSWLGLSLSTTRQHMVRAFCDGLAAQVALLVDVVSADTGTRLTRLQVDGGLTKSRTLMQIQADLLGVPVAVYPYACATALGVAALAARGLDGAGAEEPLVSGWTAEAVYEPRADRESARQRVARFAAALEMSSP